MMLTGILKAAVSSCSGGAALRVAPSRTTALGPSRSVRGEVLFDSSLSLMRKRNLNVVEL